MVATHLHMDINGSGHSLALDTLALDKTIVRASMIVWNLSIVAIVDKKYENFQ